jgi:hypothetical protein
MRATSDLIFIFHMKVKIVLDLNGCNNAQLIADAERYTTCMTGNELFADADVVAQVTTTKTALTELRNAVSAPLSETKKDNVRIKRDALDRCLIKLANKVEDIANAPQVSDLSRLDIVHSAGMVTKGQIHPQKHQFKVVNGKISGTAKLTAQGGAKAHEWQYTTDIVSYTGRIAVDSTTRANTEIANLAEATRYAFFHKPIISNTITEWEGPIILLVT